MVGTTLAHQLMNYIQTLYEQGILDHHFDRVKSLQSEENPRFFIEVISMFCNDADNIIAQVTAYLNSPTVDFVKVINATHQLKGSSSSIGGARVALACRELRQAGDSGDNERCLEALEKVKHEYSTLRQCFNYIFQMERNILTNEARRHNPRH